MAKKKKKISGNQKGKTQAAGAGAKGAPLPSVSTPFIGIDNLREWILAVFLPLGALAVFPGKNQTYNFFHFAEIPKELVFQFGVWILFALGLFAALARGRLAWRRSTLGDILVVFVAWNFICLMGAVNKMEGFKWWMHIFACAVMFFMALGGLGNPRSMRRASIGVAIGIILVSVFGIMQFIGKPGAAIWSTPFKLSNVFLAIAGKVGDLVMQAAKPASVFGNRNMGAQFIAVALPLAWVAYALRQDRIGLGAGSLSLVAGVLYASFTTTRSANIGIGAAGATAALLAVIFYWIPELKKLETGKTNPAKAIAFAFFMAGVLASILALAMSLKTRSRLAWGIPAYGGLLLCVLALGAWNLIKGPENESRPAQENRTKDKTPVQPQPGFRPEKLLHWLVPAAALILILFLHRFQSPAAKSEVPTLGKVMTTAAAKDDNLTWDLRITWWLNSREMIKDHPVFGVGPRNFAIVYPLYNHKVRTDPLFSEELQTESPHNDYVAVAAETGLPGLALFLAFGAAFFWTGLRVMARAHKREIKAAAGFLMLSGVGFALDAGANFPMAKAVPPFYLLFAAGALAYLDSEIRISRAAAASVPAEKTSAPPPPPNDPTLGVFDFEAPALYSIILAAVVSVFVLWAFDSSRRALADMYFYRGVMLQGSQAPDWKEISKQASEAAYWDPFRHDIWALVARAEKESSQAVTGQARLNLLKKSEAHAKRGLELHPYYINTLLNLGHTLNLEAMEYQEAGNNDEMVRLHEQALELYQKTLDILPTYAKARSNRAYTNLELKRFWSAEKEAGLTLGLNPYFSKGWYNQGNARMGIAREYSTLGQGWRAMAGPGFMPAPDDELGAAVFTALAAWNYSEADYDFGKVLEHEADFKPALLNRGTIKYQTGNFYGALKDFSLLGSEPTKWKALGETIKDMSERIQLFSRPGDAADKFRLMSNIWPEDPRLWFYLGNALRGAGDKPGAMEAFRKAVDLDPKFSLARNNLANELQVQGKHEEAAEQYLEAIKINDNYPDAWKNLGVLYRTMGKNQEALNAFRKSLELNPNQPQAELLRKAVNELSAPNPPNPR